MNKSVLENLIEAATLKVGDKVKAFNGLEWQKTGDIGDNSQFYQVAEIIEIRPANRFADHGLLADVMWLHNGEISCGHFLNSLKKVL